MKQKTMHTQRGISITGLIFMLMIVGFFGVLALKIVPTYTEYRSILKAIGSAKASGTTVREIQEAFNKARAGGYIDSIAGSDLEIVKNGSDIEISFAYQKKIPLVGPASLVLDYTGSTSNALVAKKPLE